MSKFLLQDNEQMQGCQIICKKNLLNEYPLFYVNICTFSVLHDIDYGSTQPVNSTITDYMNGNLWCKVEAK
jgi:hypothetical protein